MRENPCVHRRTHNIEVSFCPICGASLQPRAQTNPYICVHSKGSQAEGKEEGECEVPTPLKLTTPTLTGTHTTRFVDSAAKAACHIANVETKHPGGH